MPNQFSPNLGGGFYQTSVNQGISDYSSVLQGYQAAIGAQQGQQAQIQSGYGALQGQVANTLGYGGSPWGVAAPAAQSIADVYAQRQGAATQGLISSGLGNSTVLQSALRGNMLDTQKAYAGLGANLAQTYAGYQSNLGLAGLNQQAQAAQQQQQLRQQQLAYQGTRYNEGIAPIPGYYSGQAPGGAVRSGGISNPYAQSPHMDHGGGRGYGGGYGGGVSSVLPNFSQNAGVSSWSDYTPPAAQDYGAGLDVPQLNYGGGGDGGYSYYPDESSYWD